MKTYKCKGGYRVSKISIQFYVTKTMLQYVAYGQICENGGNKRITKAQIIKELKYLLRYDGEGKLDNGCPEENYSHKSKTDRELQEEAKSLVEKLFPEFSESNAIRFIKE